MVPVCSKTRIESFGVRDRGVRWGQHWHEVQYELLFSSLLKRLLIAIVSKTLRRNEEVKVSLRDVGSLPGRKIDLRGGCADTAPDGSSNLSALERFRNVH